MGHDVDIFKANIRVKKIGPLLNMIRNVPRKLKCYDVVHSNEGAGLFVSHPCIIETFHHDYAQVKEFGYRFFSMLEGIQCRRVKHVIVPSFASKNSLLQHGISQSKISVIYHGVDHSTFKEKYERRIELRNKFGLEKKFVVMNVSRLVKHKGLTTLMRIIWKLPGSCLILVGKGGEERKINEMKSKLGIRMLHFKDVSDEFLADLYNISDIYVHTSTIEGFGLSVLEAMACGLPVVAYNTADLLYIVGEAGFVVPQGDFQNLYNKVLLLYYDDTLRKKMRKKALERSKIFTWKMCAEEHLKAYKAAFYS
jgi:glycosyltransferase involved in cell wall biosynthesis